MTSAPTDNRTLLRRTLITSGAMLGACVALVGTLTFIASSAAGHAMSGGDTESGAGEEGVPGTSNRDHLPGARTSQGPASNSPNGLGRP